MNHWNTLVQVEALEAALERSDIVVLDARFALGAERGVGRAEWFAARIPGAIYADLEADLSDMSVTGEGRHPWPNEADFAAKLGEWGIGPDTQVVVYDADNGMYAARAWCALRALGHERVAVLDGGFARWKSLKLPVETARPGDITPRAAYPGRFDRSRLFGHEDVIAHLAHGGLLVDARAPERFRGEVEPLDRKAGHVPGAVNRPFAHNLQADGRFKPKDALYAEFAELLAGRTPSDMVAMCGSGVTACHNLLAMEHAGLGGSRVYAGSWSEWVSVPSRPIATGPV